jgi:hypothetical protein
VSIVAPRLASEIHGSSATRRSPSVSAKS